MRVALGVVVIAAPTSLLKRDFSKIFEDLGTVPDSVANGRKATNLDSMTSLTKRDSRSQPSDTGTNDTDI